LRSMFECSETSVGLEFCLEQFWVGARTRKVDTICKTVGQSCVCKIVRQSIVCHPAICCNANELVLQEVPYKLVIPKKKNSSLSKSDVVRGGRPINDLRIGEVGKGGAEAHKRPQPIKDFDLQKPKALNYFLLAECNASES